MNSIKPEVMFVAVEPKLIVIQYQGAHPREDLGNGKTSVQFQTPWEPWSSSQLIGGIRPKFQHMMNQSKSWFILSNAYSWFTLQNKIIYELISVPSCSHCICSLRSPIHILHSPIYFCTAPYIFCSVQYIFCTAQYVFCTAQKVFALQKCSLSLSLSLLLQVSRQP